MYRKRTINFRKNWQHGFSTTSYIKPGNTAVLVIPSACTTSPSDISHFSFPTPVMKYVTQCITLYRTFSYRIQAVLDQSCFSLFLRATTCHPKRATPREPPQGATTAPLVV